MGAPAPRGPAPTLCLLLACVSLPWGEPTGPSLRVQALAAAPTAPTAQGNPVLQPEPDRDPSHSSREVTLAIEDATTVIGGQGAEVLDSLAMSSWERRLHRAKCAPSLYNAGPERDSICRAWGQHHVETFDGLYYYLSGKGSYTLAGRHEPEGQTFSVQVHNDPQCGSSPYTCSRSVSLFFAGEQEIRLAKEVTHGGVRVQLPHVMGSVSLQRLAGYVLVRHQSAFTLAWDGASAVYIKMSPEFLGWTRGLCGNNNADPQDDLVTSYGKLTDDVAEFVHSWQEQAPNQPPRPTTASLPRPPCLQQSPGTMQGVYDRCEALLRPPFDACHAYVSPLPFTASCTSDLCQAVGDEATWCRALAEYARACAQAGRPLQDWRTQLRQCAVHCKEKAFTYNECIACCPASCQSQASCVDSEIACVDGCYCPDGLIFEDGDCVAPAECPCEFHGTLYPTGSVVKEDCNACTCTAGKWVCSTSVCPAECSVTGDIHFTTFDGRRYTFPATCQYILAKSRSSGTFTVTLQNAPCGLNQDGVCVQSVSVILHQDPRRQVTLTQAGDVLLFDQYKVTPPYTDDAFEIRRLSSMFLRVRTNVGVRVLYDRQGLRLYLQVDQRWVEDTVGLCGTFNGNTQDDFLSPVGVPESTPQLFGNSWKTLSACSPLVSGSPLDPCDVHLQAASYAVQSCSVLTGELFAPCSVYLSPVPYFEQCRQDACRCGQPCLCATLAHYAHLCRRHGLPVDFRAHLPACALSCEATKEYSPCVALCGQTCQDLASPVACGVGGGSDLSGDECVEGCACPPDTYLDTQADLCVPSHCKDGIMSCDSRLPATACPVGQVFVNCSDLHTDPELSRERTCEQQLLNLSVPAHGPCLSGCACPQGVCQRGSFQCALHPCASTCTAYGDRHYRTFDGLPFDFVGACKVHLVKSTSDFSFSVIVENVDCYSSGIICRKFISINVGNSLIIFDDDSGNPGQLAGLCGNFDLKTINEMRTPENLELTNPQEFGSSWAAVECPDTLDPWDTCVLNPLREPFARKECSILLSEVFETCHPVVDVTWFYSNCLTDTCGCNRGGDCECFCASVSAYAHQCCQHGVAVDWRTPHLCPYDCDFFNKALGKGPYQLASLAGGSVLVATKAAGGAIVLVSAEDVAPGDIVNFLLTAALYKAKAHDPDVVSLEAADRPNFFLHVTANGSVELAKWQSNVAFHHHASFSLHRGTWQAGLVALESLAEPGSFLYVLGPTLVLRLYEHTEVFRRGTFFRLLDAKPSGAAYPICEWHYDACASPCFRTCRDPQAASCQDVPRVEGCVPACPTPKVLDEVTQRCVYLEDCICDGDAANDLTLEDGSVVGEAQDPAPFLDSWQVPSSLTSVGQTRFRPDSCATADCSPCLRMVSNRTFSACHRFVSPESFCELWIRDTKYVQQPCVALTVYVAMCHKFHVCIEWRRSDYCPFLCSSDSIYQACVAACEPPETCQDGLLGPLDPEQCQVLGEGCVCSEGTLLHRRHSALCIPQEKCGHRLFTHFQEDSCCPSYSCECDPDLCEAELVPSCRQDQILIAGRLGDSCCTSYFCACGDCPDPIPECQEGEALTVDRNTTELCCPVYQCVCESFRCPQVQCGMGTALVEVWSPDRCCPYKSCECDCDTIPVPRCHLWEKSQLDEEFLHSVENVCGCAKYECVKAPVCLSRELGVMLPGQTVVELSADGVCHTSRCTDVLDPLTSFYQINTTSVLCDVHCEANQEYEHPRDLAACCGSCRNVSCLFTFPNGTTSLFLPGASWIANCTRHHCGNTPLGAVLVRSPISCPPLNETECAKVGGSVVPSLEGCCRTCKEDGRSCKKVTIRMTIRKNECRSNTPVNLVSCDGRCPSASIYNYNINTYARFCKCCREVGLQRRSVQLFCATNATWVPYTVQEPTDCACQWS
ncbi:low quality protein: otogelin-like [Lynx pardinus]|uniref:Low quality protein: otogelin-like n=1 Tax=Lynx pardinus TaxID=191816 RepID=A0A485N8Z4_LYNPA|nr:low quality protein: otogelin-like [Lynx pardinus]